MSAKPVNVADLFNRQHPIGTPVHAYPWTRDDKPLVTRTRTEAWSLGDGTAVVSVEGYAGGIALTHIDVVVPDEPEDEPEPTECPTCDGSGQVVVGWGRGKRTESCDACFGEGVREVG